MTVQGMCIALVVACSPMIAMLIWAGSNIPQM